MTSIKRLLFFVFFLSCLLTKAAGAAGQYLDVLPGDPVTLPDGLYFQTGYRVQWWYVTGHLFDAEGREFGYELTFFAVALQQRDYQSQFGLNTIYISHFALSDVAEKRFYFSDNTDSGAFGFAGARTDRFEVWLEDTRLEGTPEGFRLRASGPDRALDLMLIPAKPAVLHGDRGISRKSAESPLMASFYFSYTQLRTEGNLRTGGKTFRVTGKSWFDREISSRGPGVNQSGWDWFSLRLDDGREVMLYLLRNKDGTLDPYSSGTFVDRQGGQRHLVLKDFSVHVLDRYRSQKTGATYPAEWRVRIPSEDLDVNIRPLIRDQEFLGTYSTWNNYWEGTCAVEGSARGRAYVELTGY